MIPDQIALIYAFGEVFTLQRHIYHFIRTRRKLDETFMHAIMQILTKKFSNPIEYMKIRCK